MCPLVLSNHCFSCESHLVFGDKNVNTGIFNTSNAFTMENSTSYDNFLSYFGRYRIFGLMVTCMVEKGFLQYFLTTSDPPLLFSQSDRSISFTPSASEQKINEGEKAKF